MKRGVCLLLFAILILISTRSLPVNGVYIQHTLVLEGIQVNSLQWSPASDYLALQNPDGIRLFWRDRRRIEYTPDVSSYPGLSGQTGSGIAWSPDGIQLVTTYYHNLPREPSGITLKIWYPTIAMPTAIFYPVGIGQIINTVDWSPDAEKIAYTYQGVYFNGCACWQIVIWDLDKNNDNSYSSFRGMDFTEVAITDISWYLDSTLLASSYGDGTVKFWDTETREITKEFHKHEASITDIAWHPSMELIASANSEAVVQIWDYQTGKTILSIDNESPVNAIDWNADGTLLASAGDDGVIRIWNTVNGELIFTLKGHEDSIHALDWSPDDMLIATASRDNTVRLWDVSDLSSP